MKSPLSPFGSSLCSPKIYIESIAQWVSVGKFEIWFNAPLARDRAGQSLSNFPCRYTFFGDGKRYGLKPITFTKTFNHPIGIYAFDTCQIIDITKNSQRGVKLWWHINWRSQSTQFAQKFFGVEVWAVSVILNCLSKCSFRHRYRVITLSIHHCKKIFPIWQFDNSCLSMPTFLALIPQAKERKNVGYIRTNNCRTGPQPFRCIDLDRQLLMPVVTWLNQTVAEKHQHTGSNYESQFLKSNHNSPHDFCFGGDKISIVRNCRFNPQTNLYHKLSPNNSRRKSHVDTSQTPALKNLLNRAAENSIAQEPAFTKYYLTK